MSTFEHDQAYPLRRSPSPKYVLIKTLWYTRIYSILLNLIIVYISTGRAHAYTACTGSGACVKDFGRSE